MVVDDPVVLGDELEDAGPVTKLVLADGVGEVVNERTEVGVKDCELAVVDCWTAEEFVETNEEISG